MSLIRSKLFSLSSKLFYKNLFQRTLDKNQLRGHSILSLQLQCSILNQTFEEQNNGSSLMNYNSRRFLAKNKDRKKEPKKSSGNELPKIILDDDEMNKVYDYDDLLSEIDMIIDQYKAELKESYNLRLNPRQIERINVTHDGVNMVIGDISTVVNRPNEIIINLESMPSIVRAVMTALLESGLNLNPQLDGHVIFIKMPKITTEHRESLIKGVRQFQQQIKDQLKSRNLPKKYIKEDYKKLSKDLVNNAQANLNYYIKRKSQYVDELAAQKIDSLSTN